jgi:hypothetical protein
VEYEKMGTVFLGELFGIRDGSRSRIGKIGGEEHILEFDSSTGGCSGHDVSPFVFIVRADVADDAVMPVTRCCDTSRIRGLAQRLQMVGTK